MRKIVFLLLSFCLLSAANILPIAAQDSPIPALPGKIAYIGVDGNIYVLSSQTSPAPPLTTDASSDLQYRWPTWSTDGRLAYFLIKPDGSGIDTDVYVSSDGSAAGQLVYSEKNKIITYAYWSPQNCQSASDCRNLAVLLSDLTTQGFSVTLLQDGQSSNTLAGTGAPFYFSWSPDGTKMFWQRNNQSLDIYDVSTGKVLETLPQMPGYFQAPAWSPTEDRRLFGALGSDQLSTDLVIDRNDASQTLATGLSGPVAFSWSPDGNSIAYVENQGVLFIVDSHTGEIVSRSSVAGVYAFFWSPDSKQIAYITQAGAAPNSTIASTNSAAKLAVLFQTSPGIAWSVMEVSTGATTHYSAFNPTAEMAYVLSFFDQFSQSHRLWSPDSRYLIYGETTADNHSIVSILDTTQPDALPVSIADGALGIWSFN